MLVRPPSKRATLESIVNDKWLHMGDTADPPSPVSVSPTPLISEISISKDVHVTVLQKMHDGKIAHKDEIQK